MVVMMLDSDRLYRDAPSLRNFLRAQGLAGSVIDPVSPQVFGRAADNHYLGIRIR